MSKATLEQAEELVKRMTTDEKLQLVERLEQETLKARWDQLLADIDRRRKGRRFTMAEIQREVDAVRRERRGVNHSRRR